MPSTAPAKKSKPRAKAKKAKVPKEKATEVYKKARNGRVYKMVQGRPRFVSKAEAEKNGF